MSDSPPGITAAPNNDNLRHFDVTVAGPESSPYEGESFLRQKGWARIHVRRVFLRADSHDHRASLVVGVVNGCSLTSGGVFRLELFLPEEYPMNPPKVRFLTKI